MPYVSIFLKTATAICVSAWISVLADTTRADNAMVATALGGFELGVSAGFAACGRQWLGSNALSEIAGVAEFAVFKAAHCGCDRRAGWRHQTPNCASALG